MSFTSTSAYGLCDDISHYINTWARRILANSFPMIASWYWVFVPNCYIRFGKSYLFHFSTVVNKFNQEGDEGRLLGLVDKLPYKAEF